MEKIDKFWKLVDESKLTFKNNIDKQLGFIKSRLLKSKPNEILAHLQTFYSELYSGYTQELWFAVYIVHGGCSEKAFEEFLAWLISHGKEQYRKILQNPEILASHITLESASSFVGSEDFINIWEECYEIVAGQYVTRDFFDKIQKPDIKFDTSLNYKDLKEKHPKLYEKFWNKWI